MKRLISLAILALALGGCAQFNSNPAIEVTAVSLNWDLGLDDVRFTVKNTGDVELRGINVTYTAHCGGGDFTQFAFFPSPFDDDSPLAVGSTCTAATADAVLTGGTNSIEITKVSVDYSWFNKILTYTKTFMP